jgi:hypothetical protein
LYGPIVFDAPVLDAVLGMRGDRKHSSRLVRLPARGTRRVTVIAGAHDGRPCVLYTAFGGPITPQEPGDPKLLETGTPQSIQESIDFWAKHALAYNPATDRIFDGQESV